MLQLTCIKKIAEWTYFGRSDVTFTYFIRPTFVHIYTLIVAK